MTIGCRLRRQALGDKSMLLNFARLVLGAVLFSLALTAEAQTTSRPPNIVFIMADDLGRGHCGCYGQTKIRTPRIDRLAAEGMKFNQFYTGANVCAPSRS